MRILFLAFLVLCSFSGYSTHIVGGDFSLKYLGGYNYELTLKVFRDCQSGIPEFNKPLYVGVYQKGTHVMVDSIRMELRSNDTLRFVAGNCINIPTGCTHIGLYRETIVLDPDRYSNPAGYYFSWERCCRNAIIENINFPNESGMAFYMEIPPILVPNSTPVFNRNPLTLLCVNNPYRFNFDVTDADGDSLLYSLAVPLRGTLGNTISNDPSETGYPYYSSGPYPQITWKQGYGLTYMIDGNPTLTINRETGEIDVTPSSTGVYVVSVLCEEFRNGVKIGEVRREMQFTITQCGTNTNPVIRENVNNKTFHVTAPNKICFEIGASDPNDSLWMEVRGDVFDPLKVTPAASLDTSLANGKSAVAAQFCWQTTCEMQGMEPQIIDVYVRDNGCPLPKVAFSKITVIVDSMPLIPPVDMLCMGLYNNQELDLFWGDSSSPAYFGYYLLYRGTDGTFAVFDTIFDKGKTVYHDSAAADYENINYMYFMVGVNLCGVRGPNSDTITTFEQLKVDPDPAYIITATVDKLETKIKWTHAPEKDFSHYQVLKKKNLPGEVFKQFTLANKSTDTVISDANVDVNRYSYCYQVLVWDTCGNVSPASNLGCTILLQGKAEPFTHQLNWSPYVFWTGGVDHYELERKDPAIPYTLAGTYNSTTLSASDNNLNLNEGAYWYTVRAKEAEGMNAESVSNEVYLIQPPYLFVPNAFTPNNDGHNDVWGHVPVFVKDFKMSVYNRWGQMIFESDDKLLQWDGTYNGTAAWDNAFVWLATYTGYDGSTHYEYGTVTILR